MSKSFRDWLNEGETIYNDALTEYRDLESQLQQLEARMIEKRTELNQIAQMIGKPSVETPARVAAELIERDMPPAIQLGSVTRALTGRGVVAR